MQQKLFDTGACRLILFFTGWGMSPVPFRTLSKPGYDLSVVWDYTDDSFDISGLVRYDEIVVVGWSMGVYYASLVMERHPDLPYTKKIAVNGTMTPLDRDKGIDPDLFLRSAAGIADGYSRFYRRVCGGASGMARFLPELPGRDPGEMRAELLAIADHVVRHPLQSEICWDEVHISDNDLIFPPAAMRRAWENGNTRIVIGPGESHIVDFQNLIDTYVVDKDLVGERFAGASVTYDDNADAQRRVAGTLVGLARETLRGADTSGRQILEIGAGAGMLTRLYLPLFSDSDVTAWDLSGVVPSVDTDNRIHACACDAETEVMKADEGSFDFIFSSSTIQWFNSPYSFIRRLARLLRPGGKAFISCFGPGTFAEFEQGGSFVGLSYPEFSARFLRGCGFDAEVRSEEITVRFDSPREALRHLKRTGVNSVRRAPVSVADTRSLMRRLTDSDGGASLRFNAQYYILTKIDSNE